MSKSKDLAIAYSVKRKNKRKAMAEGGPVKPGPNSAKMKSQNTGNKAPGEDSWSDDPTVKQAQKPSPTKLSQPKIIGSDAFSTRNRDQHDENNDQMAAFAPSSDRDQPQRRYNEVGTNSSGPKVPDMEKQHNNQRSAYEMAVEHEYAQDVARANMKKVQSLARGGMVDSTEQPQPEADEEHAASLAAAIMSKRRMAEGGRVTSDEIHSHPSIYSDDSSQVDLSRNADEDANEEDQLSFNALTKENYSESEGLELMDSPMDSNEHGHEIDSDDHDMVSQIRRKIRKKASK